ncbi:AcvB/VirJ family lysyl-phosphatidylglycerol hydrolase [Parafilimonas sp.]|uniref:AcvB/VirJ family lysyl-phosphatidylglycerol hydrolase n=1 Tax=Parafilimonas sp. TaxID=1969739 RepID=UPI0039E4F9F2
MKASNLPIDTLSSKDMSKPLVLYISGDGGFNSFSNAFIKQWNTNGYPVVALNAKSYFWHTKSPEDAARDVSGLIEEYLSLWQRKEVLLLGYSFGADVMPFIQTRLAPAILSKVKRTVLFSPSKNTDFTIHLFYNDRGSSVPAEINKLGKPVLIVFGDKETDLPELQINNKLATIIKVEGDHHYNNAITAVIHNVMEKL